MNVHEDYSLDGALPNPSLTTERQRLAWQLPGSPHVFTMSTDKINIPYYYKKSQKVGFPTIALSA